MAEVLSQQEIDQLLNKVKSGEEQPVNQNTEKEAVLFDFRLPNRISKNQLRTIRNINENFAESFSAFLVTKLQSIININVTSIDQIYYSEYILSVSNPACLYTFEIRNTDIKGILELSMDLSLALVDKLLGGSGVGTKQSNIITPIEQKVIGVVVERVMVDLRKAWQIVDDLDFKVEPLPGAAGPHEGLVVKARRNERCEQRVHRAEVERETRPAVLTVSDQTVVQLDFRGAQIGRDPGSVAPDGHQRVGLFRSGAEQAAGPVVFERASEQVYPVGEQRRGEGVALEAAQLAPIEGEAYRSGTIDAPAGDGT